ncbi:MAG: hypothetical protein KA533_01090 [Sphingobium sp.]|nr:hypothetical protein [Sphingobium sp.]MBP6111386.1 hypothetical protein [Sphingobium sp.]MBP8670869.1 hypothetical protein [Sphingobium sp.]MBP9156704.1 hypothetical protein [Sphingobium sp.]MCC6483122.1 hypothetical protein [Sphingomonadaceae bacterium]
MKFTVNCDCTPEEARTFLGLPDLSPVHEKYIEVMLSSMDGAGSIDQMTKMLGAFAPMGDASMKLFSQMMDIGLSGAKSSGKS